MGHTYLTLSHYIETLQRVWLKDKESHNFFFFLNIFLI